MSKSTKIIAALGVVAGLGVAALPAFTYAAQTQQTVTGNADVYVEVQPAIAMTITGNNDDNHSYGTSGDNGAVDVFAPAGAASGTIDGHPTPAAPTTLASSSYVSLLPNQLGNTKSTVSVYTNNSYGYTLAVKANTSANMTMVDPSGGTDTIAAIDGTPAVGTPGWAYKVADVTETETPKTNKGTITTGFDSDSQMDTTDQVIVTATQKTVNGDDWDVTYDVATKPDQATGVYHVSLTYTATTRNGSQ